MRSSNAVCVVVISVSVLTIACCCPYFDFGESSDPEKDFEALVWSPIPPGVTPIAADYENIGLGDGHRAVHFAVDDAELMDRIIERHQLEKASCIYSERLYPLEEWQTRPKPDEIECFKYVEYRGEESGPIDYMIVLYTNTDYTEALFKSIYF